MGKNKRESKFAMHIINAHIKKPEQKWHCLDVYTYTAYERKDTLQRVWVFAEKCLMQGEVSYMSVRLFGYQYERKIMYISTAWHARKYAYGGKQ